MPSPHEPGAPLQGGPPALLVALGDAGWRTGLVPLSLFLVGVFVVAGNVIRGAWRQRYVPTALLARVVTTHQVIAYAAMPLAGVVAGALGATLGIRGTIAVMAAVHVLASVAILFSPFRGLRDLPKRPDEPVAGGGQGVLECRVP